MDIQKTDQEPVMYARSRLTAGGNTTIINGDEDDTLAASYELAPVQMAPGSEGWHPSGG